MTMGPHHCPTWEDPDGCQCATATPPKTAAPPEAPAEEFPMIAVPAGFQGTDAEAVGLAVVGAITALEKERNALREAAEEAVGALGALLAVYPQTSWAASEGAKDRGVEVHGRLTLELYGPEAQS